MNRHIQCIVHGSVQGVSYRAFVADTAGRLGLAGFTRNLVSGTVEVVAEGEEARLKEFPAQLKEKHPFARVTRVDEKWEEAVGEFRDFRIK